MFYKKRKGFTVLEILIVIFFIGFLLSVVLINYNKDKESLALLTSARAFAQSLRNTQVISGEEEIGCIIGEDYHTNYSNSYGIYMDQEDLYNYFIFADCNGDNFYNEEDDLIIDEISFEEGAKISSFTPNLNGKLHIVFVPPSPSIFINNVENEAEIIFQSERNLEETRTISINKTGRINFYE